MTPHFEVALWATAVTITLAATIVVRRPVEVGSIPLDRASQSGVRVPDSKSLHRVGQTVAATDPFRLDRTPSAVPFTLRTIAAARSVVAAAPARVPSLVVRGIAGGPPWEALIDGFPGREGTVLVRAGDRVGDWSISAIKRDTVVVRGTDTTWRLTLVRTWR